MGPRYFPTIQYSRIRAKNQGPFAVFPRDRPPRRFCRSPALGASGGPRAPLGPPSARQPADRAYGRGFAKEHEKTGPKGIDFFPALCYTSTTRGCSSSVELRLPKPIRWVRLPSSAPAKEASAHADASFAGEFFGGSRTGAVSENVSVTRLPRAPACAAAQVDSHHPLQKRQGPRCGPCLFQGNGRESNHVRTRPLACA